MMNSIRRSGWLQVIGFLVCIAILLSAAPSALADENYPSIKAMTRNLYLGADIFKVVEAAERNPKLVPFAVADVYNTMLFTNFWARAEAIADEIAEKQPMVVGLQEVSTFYRQTPGDFLRGNPVAANKLVIDFYAVLDAAMKRRGLNYEAFSVTNADVELPMIDFFSRTLFSDVRMVDRDMILVKRSIPATEVLSGNYQTNLSTEIAGTNLEFTRGFLIVDVEVNGVPYRFVNTHLEVRSEPGSGFRVVQAAQMQELLLTLEYYRAIDPKPVILVGDFNSSPEDEPGVYNHPDLGALPYVPPYMQAVAGGYIDTWTAQDTYGDGFTSGFGEYISNPRDELTSRIDLIFVNPLPLMLLRVGCDVVGEEVSDMVRNPIAPRFLKLWPSDHAGVVAQIKLEY